MPGFCMCFVLWNKERKRKKEKERQRERKKDKDTEKHLKWYLKVIILGCYKCL